MTQDQIIAATTAELEARQLELEETITDPNTDPNLYYAATKELEAVKVQHLCNTLDEFWAPFCN